MSPAFSACTFCCVMTGADGPESAKPSEAYAYSSQDCAYDAAVVAATNSMTRLMNIAAGRKRKSTMETPVRIFRSGFAIRIPPAVRDEALASPHQAQRFPQSGSVTIEG